MNFARRYKLSIYGSSVVRRVVVFSYKMLSNSIWLIPNISINPDCFIVFTSSSFLPDRILNISVKMTVWFFSRKYLNQIVETLHNERDNDQSAG